MYPGIMVNVCVEKERLYINVPTPSARLTDNFSETGQAGA